MEKNYRFDKDWLIQFICDDLVEFEDEIDFERLELRILSWLMNYEIDKDLNDFDN